MSPPDSDGHDSPRPSFRDRLANIPDADADPVRPDWDTAAPPVIRRPAPVARPNPRPEPQVPAAEPPQHRVEHRDDPGLDDSFEPVGPRRRRRWPMVLFALFAVVALAIVGALFTARRTFDSIERVPVAQALSPAVADGRNILLVGTDSREGIDADVDNAGLILGDGLAGERSDTIMILRIEESGSRFLSLPRDLWLPINSGGEQRINTALGQGPEALINTVRNELGVPITNYVQVDLAGFIELVDAVGGVEMTIEHPAFDRQSGLDLPTAGVVTLDSTQALAWVRSRHFTEIVDGVERKDGTSDIGRVARQQDFMRALLSKAAAQRNPLVLNQMAGSVADALVMDDATSLSDALEIANAMRSSEPESVVLPTSPATRGSASVLVLAPGADEVLAQFGAN